MIVWSGWGFLTALIIFGCLCICQLVMDRLWGEGYYSDHHWTIAMGMLAAAPIVWVLGRYLRKRTGRAVIDKETGKELILDGNRHTLFFIPMHLWGPVLVAISVVLLFCELFKAN